MNEEFRDLVVEYNNGKFEININGEKTPFVIDEKILASMFKHGNVVMYEEIEKTVDEIDKKYNLNALERKEYANTFKLILENEYARLY